MGNRLSQKTNGSAADYPYRTIKTRVCILSAVCPIFFQTSVPKLPAFFQANIQGLCFFGITTERYMRTTQTWHGSRTALCLSSHLGVQILSCSCRSGQPSACHLQSLDGWPTDLAEGSATVLAQLAPHYSSSGGLKAGGRSWERPCSAKSALKKI